MVNWGGGLLSPPLKGRCKAEGLHKQLKMIGLRLNLRPFSPSDTRAHSFRIHMSGTSTASLSPCGWYHITSEHGHWQVLLLLLYCVDRVVNVSLSVLSTETRAVFSFSCIAEVLNHSIRWAVKRFTRHTAIVCMLSWLGVTMSLSDVCVSLHHLELDVSSVR